MSDSCNLPPQIARVVRSSPGDVGRRAARTGTVAAPHRGRRESLTRGLARAVLCLEGATREADSALRNRRLRSSRCVSWIVLRVVTSSRPAIGAWISTRVDPLARGQHSSEGVRRAVRSVRRTRRRRTVDELRRHQVTETSVRRPARSLLHELQHFFVVRFAKGLVVDQHVADRHRGAAARLAETECRAATARVVTGSILVQARPPESPASRPSVASGITLFETWLIKIFIELTRRIRWPDYTAGQRESPCA